MILPRTGDLLLIWDSQRPRSKQDDLGMSELGGCRKAAGFRLARYPRAEMSGSVQAVMGTAIHEAAAQVMADLRERGVIPADTLIEEELRFGGVLGHADVIVPPIVRDIKTVGFKAQLDDYRLNGPPVRHVWQVSLYAAAAIRRGMKITTVQLDYLERGSGDTWLWEAPFMIDSVRSALDWLRTVQETPLDMLSRDYAPESAVCEHCPFSGPCWEGGVPRRDPRSVMYVEDPDAAMWMDQLERARADRKAAEKLEAEAKGALDALRPNDKGSAEVDVGEAEKNLRFTVSETERLDADQVRQDYARAGGGAPYKASSSVKLTFVPKPDITE